jgi:MATE family multidrug resistance protein
MTTARPLHHHHGVLRFRPSNAELRALLRLAVPIVAVQVGLMMMGVVDTIVVGRLSAAALAGVAVGNMYFHSVAIFGMGVLLALDPIVAQAVGARDPVAIGRAVQRGLLVALVLAVIVSLGFLPAEPVLHALHQPPEVVPLAAQFTRIMIPGALPFFAFIVLRQSLQSMTVVRPIVIAIVIANLTNLLLNWMLVFGNLGAPALGVAGSAWATTISRGLLFAIVLAATWPTMRSYLLPIQRASFDPAALLRMCYLGVPIGFHHLMEYGLFAAVMVIMGTLGTIQVASHQVALNLASLTFMVPFGVSQAGGVLVGHAVGRGDADAARRAAGAALFCGTAFMAAMGVVFLIMPERLASIYTRDVGVLALSIILLRLAGVFQIFDGLQVVSTGILRGAGDTRVPAIAGLVGYWLVGMPISLAFGFAFNGGAVGLWWGLVAGLAAVAIFLMARVYHRFTGALERVPIESEPIVLIADRS